jgi:hypothetical protein
MSFCPAWEALVIELFRSLVRRPMYLEADMGTKSYYRATSYYARLHRLSEPAPLGTLTLDGRPLDASPHLDYINFP